MTETTIGREPVQIVEIQQPYCANTFGSAPCTATGTADEKCYNTRATCLDGPNFALGTALSLYFAKGHVADMGVSGAPYILPSLVSVSTAPTRVNLATSNSSAQGLGNRALCTITLQDHQHTDRRVDPYLAGRSWDPMAATRGSFWGRWLARNKYRQNVVLKIYEGYAGEALGSMRVRSYFLQSVTPPDATGRITLQGKDVLAKLEERKAQAPLASPGVLYAAITDSATSFEVANAVEAEYDATGSLRIGDEVLTYTGRATSTNGINITGVVRGTDGTAAAAHDVGAGVQQCLRFTGVTVDSALETLLETYGGVAAGYLDTAGWATEAANYLGAYTLTTIITAPVAVARLVSEIQEQALCYIWWDERAAKVKLKAIRGIDTPADTLTDVSHILADSFSIKEKPRERASQVWVYYDQQKVTAGTDDPTAYRSQYVIADLESETDEFYGEASIRTIYARWLVADDLAQNTASKIILRYVDVPAECTFRLDAKDRAYWVGDTVKISHHLDVDAFGDRRERQWSIVSAEEKVPGEVAEYVAEDTTLYGIIHFVMASGAADYPGAASAPFKNCYVGDSAGLLSDGTASGTIA